MPGPVHAPVLTSAISPPPISPELWSRLRRFDLTCEIAMIRTHPTTDSPWSGKVPRIWVVTIRKSGGLSFAMAQAAEPALADALLAAVEDAERREWAR